MKFNKRIVALGIILTIVAVGTYYVYHLTQNSHIQSHLNERPSEEILNEISRYEPEAPPVDPFNENEWGPLVETHKNSPCKNDLTDDCLVHEVVSLFDISIQEENHRYLNFLTELAIEQSDRKTAKSLLEIWRASKNMPENMRIPLLLLTGAQAEAEIILANLQEQKKAGSDYRAISTLVKMGELEAALKVSKNTLEWTREAPDPNQNSSAIMHCENYQETRPEAMGKLALSFIQRSEVDKAYEVGQMIRKYWENDAYGQESFCYIEAAKRGYLSVMQELMKFYFSKGYNDEVGETFDEASAVLQTNTDEVKYFDKWAFEELTITAVQTGLMENIGGLAEFTSENTGMKYPEIYSQNTNDPVALIYALAGNYDKAVSRVEGYKYSENRQPKSEMEKLLNLEETPDDEIRLTTYLKIADTLASIGDKKGTHFFIEKAKPYLGSRKSKYNSALPNLKDYVTIANILLKIDEKEKSFEVFEELIQLFNQTNEKNHRGGQIDKSFYGQLAYLYAHFEDIYTVQQWANQLPSFYAGSYYARIAALLIQEKRWDELDAYMPEMARVLSTDLMPTGNWYVFFSALIKEGEFDRYLQFMDMLDEGTEADRIRQKTTLTRVALHEAPAIPDTRTQVKMMSYILASKLSGSDIPQKIIETVWPRHMNNCRMWGHILPSSDHEGRILPNAKELMAACYVAVLHQDLFESRYN